MKLASGSEWLKVFDPGDGILTVAGVEPAPGLGTAVSVDLMLAEARVVLRGQVVRTGKSGTAIALGISEREKINYLNGFVRGGLLNLREQRRLPLRLAVTYGGLQGPAESFTRDFSESGTFVAADEPLPEGTQVNVLVGVPGLSNQLSLTGSVNYTRFADEDDVPGMGIVFLLDDKQKDELRRVVDTLEAAMADGSLPDSVYG